MRGSITVGLSGALMAVTTLAGASIASAESSAAACTDGYARAKLTIHESPSPRAASMGTYARGSALCIYKAERYGAEATKCGETSRVWLKVYAPVNKRGWVFEPCVLH
ncbi:hypothetical protein [Streptomyces sp. Rer75]|uniref:hypothetical protein n=1 Tax=Streptomyces sp. Rer75 TaxID=2750011 RepID=UPI0015D06F2E|nr:hypothetical protein [Streptomyces sp. Rer75]QLH23671.1 hypothetical protein HYQ63_26125 [Streptomyces sp. Rer75]